MSPEQLSTIERRDPSTTEEFVSEGLSVAVRRQHCVDASEPDEVGLHEFYYDYELFEFCLGDTTLHGRAYADEPNDAHFLAVEKSGNRDLLTANDLRSPLAEAAIRYLRGHGRTNLSWLDSSNKDCGYSLIP